MDLRDDFVPTKATSSALTGILEPGDIVADLYQKLIPAQFSSYVASSGTEANESTSVLIVAVNSSNRFLVPHMLQQVLHSNQRNLSGVRRIDHVDLHGTALIAVCESAAAARILRNTLPTDSLIGVPASSAKCSDSAPPGSSWADFNRCPFTEKQTRSAKGVRVNIMTFNNNENNNNNSNSDSFFARIPDKIVTKVDEGYKQRQTKNLPVARPSTSDDWLNSN